MKHSMLPLQADSPVCCASTAYILVLARRQECFFKDIKHPIRPSFSVTISSSHIPKPWLSITVSLSRHLRPEVTFLYIAYLFPYIILLHPAYTNQDASQIAPPPCRNRYRRPGSPSTSSGTSSAAGRDTGHSSAICSRICSDRRCSATAYRCHPTTTNRRP